MTQQTLYNGVLFPVGGPDPENVARIDFAVMPCIVSMMSRGLRVSLSHFDRMAKQLSEDMDRATEEVRDLTGYYINLDSGDQVSDLLFKKLKLKQARPRFTKSGDRESVENEILTAIQHDHPVVPKILDYKEYSKLKGTYVAPMPKLARRVAHDEWRLFPNIGLTRIPSGRFNATRPNLLAFPNRTARGREVCEGFTTDDNWVYLSCDLSQIEMRVCAHRSLDPALIRVYEADDDVYSDFAVHAFKLEDNRYKDADGWHYPSVDRKAHRFPSKTCILSAIYRISAKGLLEKMPILCGNCGWKQEGGEEHLCPSFLAFWTEEKCQQILNTFLLTYQGVPQMWMRDDAYVKQHAYICDECGRMQHVTAVRSVLQWVVNTALREAGNLPVQGLAAEIFKLGLSEVHDTLEREGMLGDVVHLLLPVHDEIVAEVRSDMVEEIGSLIQFVFEHVIDLAVPIKSGVATAISWGKLAK